MRKIFCGILIAFMTLSAISAPVSAKSRGFLNVSPWAEDEVNQAKELNLIPEEMLDDDLTENVTRAEFAAVAVKLLDKLNNGEIFYPGEVFIEDVNDHEYYSYIINAYLCDITTGTSTAPVMFSPDMNITREQLATMLLRVVKKTAWNEWFLFIDDEYKVDYSVDSKFEDDALISDYAAEPVYFMSKHSIAKGTGDNLYAPGASATREQAILMALRCYNEFSKIDVINEMQYYRLRTVSEPLPYQQIYIDYAKTLKSEELTNNGNDIYLFTDLNGDEIPEMLEFGQFDAEDEDGTFVWNKGYYIKDGKVVSDSVFDDNMENFYLCLMEGLPNTTIMYMESLYFQGTFVNKLTKDPKFLIRYGEYLYTIDYVENQGFTKNRQTFSYDACREYFENAEPLGYGVCKNNNVAGAVTEGLINYQLKILEKEAEKEEIPEDVDYSYTDRFTIEEPEDVEEAKKYETIKFLKIDTAFLSDFSFLKDIKIEMLQVLYNKEPIDMSYINKEHIEQIYLVDVPYINGEAVQEFEKLTHFTIKFSDNIKSEDNLSFLSECENAVEVSTQNYGIENLDFAKKMKKLKKVTVVNSAVSDIGGIENCDKLEMLYITRAKIGDISALENLKNLSVVDLSDNYITDTEVFLNMPKLSYLNLSHNDLKEIADLSGLKELISVKLGNNYLTDIPGELLNSESILDVSYNNINKLTEEDIDNISKAQYVNLFDNMVDIDTLKKLVSLGDNVALCPEEGYLTTDEGIAYSEKIYEILPTLDKGTEKEKIMRVVKYITDNCEVDYSLNGTDNGNAYGALFDKAICGGTTELTNSLLRHLGFRVRDYNGDMNDPNDAQRHVWSLVYTDGQFYHCDAMQSMGSNKDENSFPLLVLLSDDEISEFGHILDALSRFEITEGITKEQRAEIINNIMMQ